MIENEVDNILKAKGIAYDKAIKILFELKEVAEYEDKTRAFEQKFHEVISNSLMHREYTNAFPAKLIVGKNKVVVENWNRPNGMGFINPNACLLYTSPSPRDATLSRMPSSA